MEKQSLENLGVQISPLARVSVLVSWQRRVDYSALDWIGTYLSCNAGGGASLSPPTPRGSALHTRREEAVCIYGREGRSAGSGQAARTQSGWETGNEPQVAEKPEARPEGAALRRRRA